MTEPLMLIETTDDLWLEGYLAGLEDAKKAVLSSKNYPALATERRLIFRDDVLAALDDLAKEDVGYEIQHIQHEGG